MQNKWILHTFINKKFNFERFYNHDMSTILLKNIKLKGSECNILIDGDRISRISLVSDGLPCHDSGVEILDCSGKAAFPGLVNMHVHAAMTMMRGLGEDVMFHDWLARIWEVESKIDQDYVYHATKVACLEMIKTGTTTFNDNYWYHPSARKAALEMGIRPVLSYVICDRNDPEESKRQKIQCEEKYSLSLSWPEKSQFIVAVHAIYSVREEMIAWTANFARDRGLKMHIHVSETEREVQDCLQLHGCSPVEYLDRLGVLGPDVIAAHTLWLSDKDVEILGKRKVNCVHNINSNLKLSSGFRFRYNELRDAGANVCLGTDGCASSNNLDLHEAMKTAALVQKAWRQDPTAMPLSELIDMATVNGADALGLESGQIKEGMLADILIVDMENSFFLSPAPEDANFVYSAHSDCIDSVICNGKFIMKNRMVPGEKEIIARAREILPKYL